MAENTSIGIGEIKACGHLWMILKAIPIQNIEYSNIIKKQLNKSQNVSC